jgi:hypothetical protein
MNERSSRIDVMKTTTLRKFLATTLLITGFNSALDAAITGYWTYEQQDLFLSARIGQPMLWLDDETLVSHEFGRSGEGQFANIPNINGQQVAFLKFPKTGPTGGFYVPHSAAPNGGGGFINRYTIIMDVLFPADSSGKRRALFQTDLVGNGEFFIDAQNRIGVDGGTFAGTIAPDTWYRVAFAVDLTVPSVAYFINGTKVFEGSPGSGLDGRFSLPADRFYFQNDDDGEVEVGYLAALQFRDERTSDGLILALGGPSAGGILTGPPPDPYVVRLEPDPGSVIFPERSTVGPVPLVRAIIIDGTNVLNTTTVTLLFNGQAVVPTVVKNDDTNTITYQVPSLLPELSTNTVRINYQGASGTPYSVQWQFLVGRYVALDATSAAPLGSANTPGFLVRNVQAPISAVILNVNSFPRAIKQLNGTLTDTGGVLVANEAIGGPNPNGSYDIDLINFHLLGGSFGNFDTDSPFPGVPGSEGSPDVFATEVLAFVELNQPGVYRFGVSVSVDRTDTGTDDGFQLYSSRDARNILSPVLGSFSRRVTNPFASTHNNNEFAVYAPVAGTYSIRLVHFQTFQDSSLELYSLDEATGEKVLVNSADPRAIPAYRNSTAPFANRPYLAEVNPPAGAAGVDAAVPIELLVIDDAAQVVLSSVRLFLNNVQVTPTVNRTGGRTTIFYQPNLTRTEVTNRMRLVYSDNGTPAMSFTNDWQFTIRRRDLPPVNVTGQWDFDHCDLSATIGQPLEFLGGLTGQTATGTQFGTTTSFGIPDINGQSAAVMFVPGTANNQIGYIMRHGIGANGGGNRVNQYTLVMDIYWVNTGPGFASFVNFDLSNTSDGDFFWRRDDGGFGQGGGGYEGNMFLNGDAWHRVVFAVDMGANPPIVTKFLDGKKHADQTAPNNVLDGDRRTMPVQGAVLLADGDDGERHACYVNSIQIREGKVSDAEAAALGGPSASGIPVAMPATTVKGQWDFDFAAGKNQLGPTVGQALEYFDGLTGQTAGGTQFGTTTSFGIPDINGDPANVMSVPGTANNQIGYIMRHGIGANGGGSRVNQYTLVMDIYWVNTGPGFASFVNFDLSNTSDGDFFWRRDDGGFGQGGGGYEGNTFLNGDAWHRVVFAVDMAANPPIVTKFLDGKKHADQTAPNNVLDGDRRTMPVQGAVLLADGDDGERHACYVNSIQIREGKISDAEAAALGGPSARGIPVALPATGVKGQWDFDFAAGKNQLGPTVGQALEYFDGATGQTATGTQFGTTTSFGIPDIGGAPANVMSVPGTANNQIGYIMRHGIGANGGGSRVNQYTLVMDVYWVTTGPGFASFINFDLSNTSDGDFFWRRSDGGFGQGGGGYEGSTVLTAETWHRVAFAVDMAANPPVVTKFLDGVKHADQTAPNNVLDGDRRTMPVQGAVLLGDGDDGERHPCYVNSIQIREGKLSDAELAALGGPTSAGIPLLLVPSSAPIPRLGIHQVGNSVRIVWPAGLTGYTLEGTGSLANPNWQAVPGVDAACSAATVQITGQMQFFRLIRQP